MSNIEITEKHQEILREYQREFEEYCAFQVRLVVDTDIKDTYGEEFDNVKLVLSDNEIRDREFDILIDSLGGCHYDVYDCNTEQLDYPSNLWKFMYLTIGA